MEGQNRLQHNTGVMRSVAQNCIQHFKPHWVFFFAFFPFQSNNLISSLSFFFGSLLGCVLYPHFSRCLMYLSFMMWQHISLTTGNPWKFLERAFDFTSWAMLKFSPSPSQNRQTTVVNGHTLHFTTFPQWKRAPCCGCDACDSLEGMQFLLHFSISAMQTIQRLNSDVIITHNANVSDFIQIILHSSNKHFEKISARNVG